MDHNRIPYIQLWIAQKSQLHFQQFSQYTQPSLRSFLPSYLSTYLHIYTHRHNKFIIKLILNDRSGVGVGGGTDSSLEVNTVLRDFLKPLKEERRISFRIMRQKHRQRNLYQQQFDEGC